MNYHGIEMDSMLNGEGLRVVLWVSGCEIGCKGCHNPQTHDINSGIPFDTQAKEELFRELDKPYISGITFSGGHPLHPCNIAEINSLIDQIRELYPTKSIWLYTGCVWEELKINPFKWTVVSKCDVVCDGPFVEDLKDQNTKWVGSSNQRVIDVQESIKQDKLVKLDS